MAEEKVTPAEAAGISAECTRRTALRRETLRYLGYGTRAEEKAGDAVLAVVDACLDALEAACTPRYLAKRLPLRTEADGAPSEAAEADGCEAARSRTPLLHFGQDLLTVRSRDLARNLRGLSEVFLFAGTLGPQADRLIARETRRDVSRGVIAAAAASALIEDRCDGWQAEMRRQVAEEGKTLRPRFSPGYGDFDIGHQRDILRLLDAARGIGLTLTDGLMLAPTKSVTAVMGIAPTESQEERPEAAARQASPCAACGRVDCPYRRP